MTWVKLDDRFFDGDKARAVGKDGRVMFLAGLCYCAKSLSDGKIPKTDATLVAAMAGVAPKVARKLVEVGLWDERGADYFVPDYLEFNPSREQIIAKRDATKERQRRLRNASRNAATDGVENAQCHTPFPFPNPPVSESPSSSTPSSGAVEEDERLEAVWGLLAAKRLRDQQNRGNPPGNPASWLRTVAKNARDEHYERAAQLCADYSPEKLRAHELADVLDGSTSILRYLQKDSA